MLFFSSLFPYATNIMATNFSNGIAQSFYGFIVLCVTFSNTLSYATLISANQENHKFQERMSHRNKWAAYDIGLKILGLLLSLTIWPAAMSFAVLLTLVIFVIPHQLEKTQ